MQTDSRRNIVLGLAAGVGLASLAGVLMGQGASQPVKSETQYFVTGEGGRGPPVGARGLRPPLRWPRGVRGPSARPRGR
jgi:hypothetical protein